MTGCLYKLNGEVRAYPNIDRLKKKHPDAEIIKEVENVNNIARELLAYNGATFKEQQIFPEQRPYTHTYRVNQNTVLCAYSQEELDKLKKNWNIN